MARKDYPLRQVLEIKKKRVEAAELVVKEKQQILQQEEERLAQRKAERDKVLQHHKDKMKQLRDELDHATTSPKVQQMKVYIKIVQERLMVEEKKVKEQQGKVDIAIKDLEDAKRLLHARRQEVDKVETHRTSWETEKNKEDEIASERNMDELGTMIHSSRRRMAK